VDLDVAVFGGKIAGEIILNELHAADVGMINSFDAPDAVSPVTRTISATDGGVRITLPAHSHTVLQAQLAAG